VKDNLLFNGFVGVMAVVMVLNEKKKKVQKEKVYKNKEQL